MQNKYDYIITGAGCAGLSLLRRMTQHSFFSNKKILLIDKQQKNNNDRTWCFWEKQKGIFEDIIYHRWQQVDFYSNYFSARYDVEPYEYKMIRGIDLYAAVLSESKQYANIEVIFDEVENIFSNEDVAVVKTSSKELCADYIFNSILFEDWKQKAVTQKNVHVLLQHFKGWLIETKNNHFNERIATFMDFRVAQNKGTTFVYVLPVTENKALVEYTLFSENVLEQNEYDKALKEYIQSTLNIKHYTIAHEEFGIIPMTNYNFSAGEERIINMGTAGGDTKGSTGYTFQFIQKHCEAITEALISRVNPLIKKSVVNKRFNLYDGILLNVLANKKLSGDKMFAQLFKKNSPQAIFKFLDNETDFLEELKIMNSVSLSAFLPAALKQIF